MDAHQITLQTINKGTVPEIFAKYVEIIIANIADPNTSVSKPRKLIMEFTFTPFPDRSGAVGDLSRVDPVLAGMDTKEFSCSMHFAKKDGKFMAFTRDLKQELLFPDEKDEVPDGKTASANP